MGAIRYIGRSVASAIVGLLVIGLVMDASQMIGPKLRRVRAR